MYEFVITSKFDICSYCFIINH
jgi:hypothetical protein